MIYRQKKTFKIAVVSFVILFILILSSLFIKVPLKIETYSEVFPNQKWLLTQGKSGQIISNIVDFVNGYTSDYNITSFERGEFVSMNLSEFLKDKKEINMGDTIVCMHSSNVQEQLTDAAGELEIALSNLKAQNSPDKKASIAEAENRLEYTQEKIKEQEVLFQRAQKLLDKGYSSSEEYETVKWALDLLKIEEKIYSAQLENLETGVKPEEIKLLESEVNSAQNRLELFEHLQSSLMIVSPINGKIISSFAPDTLLNISNFEQVVLHTPVKLIDLCELHEGQTIQIYFSGLDTTYQGKIVTIDKEVKLVSNQQVVFISLLLDNPDSQLLPGMIVENSFQLHDITLFNYLIKDFIN